MAVRTVSQKQKQKKNPPLLPTFPNHLLQTSFSIVEIEKWTKKEKQESSKRKKKVIWQWYAKFFVQLLINPSYFTEQLNKNPVKDNNSLKFFSLKYSFSPTSFFFFFSNTTSPSTEFSAPVIQRIAQKKRCNKTCKKK